MNSTLLHAAILLFLSLLILACKECSAVESVSRATIKNNSNKQLVSVVSKLYPDTLLPLNTYDIAGLLPNNQTFFDTRKEWEEFFADLPADTLSVFFIDAQVYNTVPYETIRSQNLILKRKEFSLQDLQSSGFVISYP